jgi:uncharacterized membrane protein YebE (DUF533 family)
MSLMGTLGRVAMGVIVAKGVSKVMGGGRRGDGSGGLGGLLGGLTGGGRGSSGGGINQLLGGLSGKSGGGGLGSILNSLGGGSGSGSGGLGGLLNQAMQGNSVSPSAEEETQAEIMLRAMISAAKADGKIDDEEQKKIAEHLGDVSDDEANFVRQELSAPLDIDGLIKSVPRGMEQQVYFMSLMAIDLDSKEEAVYLDKLAKGLNISNQVSNQIHEKLGAPSLYS